MTQSEIKKAKKLKKLRRKIALKAMLSILPYETKYEDLDSDWDEVAPIIFKFIVNDSFAIADEFIRQQTEKEATK